MKQIHKQNDMIFFTIHFHKKDDSSPIEYLFLHRNETPKTFGFEQWIHIYSFHLTVKGNEDLIKIMTYINISLNNQDNSRIFIAEALHYGIIHARNNHKNQTRALCSYVTPSIEKEWYMKADLFTKDNSFMTSYCVALNSYSKKLIDTILVKLIHNGWSAFRLCILSIVIKQNQDETINTVN